MRDEGTSKPVVIIGAGLDLGAGRRGVDMGPSAIRYAGLQERIIALGRECLDWGDVEAGGLTPIESLDGLFAEEGADQSHRGSAGSGHHRAGRGRLRAGVGAR